MAPLEQGIRFSPSTEAVHIVRVTLQGMGFRISEPDARRVVEAVLAVEGPRMHSVVRGSFENSLEIIRDTAESALRGLEKPVERSDQLGGGHRPVAPRRPLELPEEELDDDEPRPVFKRPRR